ncbi:hypothetical protein L198_00771 [Cryptococcus wingfieldii CBS 7118]|uniref:Uncharacterized protein n=1 Tax=Cryptococcus wingfieldii CBS 7118 TaxID=1295528 RepID=A0A1E3K4M0_9TREE|nr:hypothetical protein L198_00771 [Cryptococcus wingfieldii CBS 7118]ODO07192.1 hypothetical protein L198_00771 [Cryptococcus wingfieldii CBS 7118]
MEGHDPSATRRQVHSAVLSLLVDMVLYDVQWGVLTNYEAWLFFSRSSDTNIFYCSPVVFRMVGNQEGRGEAQEHRTGEEKASEPSIEVRGAWWADEPLRALLGLCLHITRDRLDINEAPGENVDSEAPEIVCVSTSANILAIT